MSAGTFEPRMPKDARASTGNGMPYRVPACAIEHHRHADDQVAEHDRDDRLLPVHAGADEAGREHVGRDADREPDPERGDVIGASRCARAMRVGARSALESAGSRRAAGEFEEIARRPAHPGGDCRDGSRGSAASRPRMPASPGPGASSRRRMRRTRPARFTNSPRPRRPMNCPSSTMTSPRDSTTPARRSPRGPRTGCSPRACGASSPTA